MYTIEMASRAGFHAENGAKSLNETILDNCHPDFRTSRVSLGARLRGSPRPLNSEHQLSKQFQSCSGGGSDALSNGNPRMRAIPRGI